MLDELQLALALILFSIGVAAVIDLILYMLWPSEVRVRENKR